MSITRLAAPAADRPSTLAGPGPGTPPAPQSRPAPTPPANTSGSRADTPNSKPLMNCAPANDSAAPTARPITTSNAPSRSTRPHHIGRRCAERHAQSDLGHALVHGVGHHAIDAGDRQQQRDHREHHQQHRPESRRRRRARHRHLHRLDAHRHLGIAAANLPRRGGANRQRIGGIGPHHEVERRGRALVLFVRHEQLRLHRTVRSRACARPSRCRRWSSVRANRGRREWCGRSDRRPGTSPWRAAR